MVVNHSFLLANAVHTQSHNTSIILKKLAIKKGDLIFFNNGGGVSHVGIVSANKNGEIEMVHASSSKGIIITDVTSSKYWSKRIHSYGTFLEWVFRFVYNLDSHSIVSIPSA